MSLKSNPAATGRRERHHVAVLGGGISGLATAYRLIREGKRVTLFEASGELGGLGETFEHEGHTLEKFYHVMIDTDENLLSLLDELNLKRDVRWTETGMGFLHGKTLYPFNTPMDLLRFGGLSVPARLRTALGAFYVAKLLNKPDGLDEVGVGEWLRNIFGVETFQQLWRPLLRAKFGDMYDTVPAYWFWTRMRREKGGAKEVKGYVFGGYRRIVERLRSEIERMGGTIRLRSAAYAIQSSPWNIQVLIEGKWEAFDAIVSTLPLPLLHKIVRGPIQSQLPQRNLPYQGVVNAVAILKNRLQPYYWNAIVRKDYPFQGLVETTHVVPESQTGGRHLVYLMNYCAQGSEVYSQADAVIKFQALKSLRDFNPKFQPDWVEDIQVFRAPHVEPLWNLGYAKSKPKVRVGDTRLYLATTAQCYPQVNSWNTMTGIANEAAAQVKHDLENVLPRYQAPAATRQPQPMVAVA